MAHALSQKAANEKVESLSKRDHNQKATMKRLEGALVQKAVVTLVSAGYGAIRKHKLPLAVKGFPWKLGVWAVATIGEAMTKGMTQQAFSGVSNTTLASYTENAVAGGSLVGAEDGGSI